MTVSKCPQKRKNHESVFKATKGVFAISSLLHQFSNCCH
jgi:hypothetical protein